MNEVSSQEGTWVEPTSNRRFHYRCWRPATSQGLLVIVHGFGEHGGRYQAFARALAARGLSVAVPDLWGHGRSGGRRGDMEDVADCARDLRALTQAVFLPASGQTRYAVFGHSFGGLVAILWALNESRDLRRVVIQSPLLESGFPIPPWKLAAAGAVARWWPACPFPMNLDAGALSRDPAVGAAYRADPLVHNTISLRTYRAIQRARDEASARAPTLGVPVLLMCGAEDRVVSVEAAQRWFERVGGEKRNVLFPGCYHELHHEAIRDEVLRLVREWVVSDG